MPERALQLNGASIHVEDTGNGAPIVLIHGGLSSHVDWAPVVSELADDYRVITPDSRGHGSSTNPAGTLSYAAIADDIAALIAALELRRPIVGGWSDGGQATLELAVRHPGVAAALVVGAAYPEFRDSGLREAHRALLGADATGTPDLAFLDMELEPLGPELKARHAGGAEHWPVLIRHTAEMWLGYPGLSPEAVEAIDVPVLVLAGDRDELIPLDLSAALYRALPNAELAVCPALGHDGPSPERAAALAGLIRDFAQRHAHA
jgi:pimeloyl-ACP methyl ester carboxylesterase